MLTNTTIASISTGLINSGISIIRISGKDSLKIIKRIFTGYRDIEPNKIIYGSIINSKNEIMDKVLVSYFKAPKSYTGEDICEINCHGGKQITLEILDEVLKNGAIIAEPGEFSKRAFLNGKMDLSQAEAISNLIESKTSKQAKIAVNQLQGKLSEKIKNNKEKLVDLLAQIEVNIDYPEYDYEQLSNENILNIVKNIEANISKMLSSYEEGKIINSGVNVAILGAPNVGKSSLLNNLANYEKAIVTDIPGTTRDIVDETINLGDVVLNISDTAGIRNTEDIVEKIGVQKSIKKLDEVDLVIYILSCDQKISNIDIEMLSKIKEKSLKFIIINNKIDIKQDSILNENIKKLKKIGINGYINISVKTDKGIDELKNKILEYFKLNDFDYTKDFIIVNKRHKDLLLKSDQLLLDCIKDIKNGQSVDIIEIAIKQAASYLGQIIGDDVSIDLVNTIFEKFCLGK